MAMFVGLGIRGQELKEARAARDPSLI